MTIDIKATQALRALNDLRAHLRRQPGFVSNDLFENLNRQHEPRYVHLSHWASINYWAAVFRSPDFARLQAHAQSHYRVTTTALVRMD